MDEGQWRVDDARATQLEKLDAETDRAVQAHDEAALHAALQALHDAVCTSGQKLNHTPTSANPTPPCHRSI